jgi:hypothetical protein
LEFEHTREADGWVSPKSRAALEKLPVSTGPNEESELLEPVIHTHTELILSYTNRHAAASFA